MALVKKLQSGGGVDTSFDEELNRQVGKNINLSIQ